MRLLPLPLLAAGVLIVVGEAPLHSRLPASATALRCRLAPGKTLATVRVERDTTLPFRSTEVSPSSLSSVRPSGADSLLASVDTPMPAARVRLLQLDSLTRAVLVDAGITDRQPTVFIRAAPYRADCRTIRWTDTVPWVVAGDIGFVRATLETRERWITGVPVFVIPDAWNYPFPRQRGLVFGVPLDSPVMPPDAMYSFRTALERPTVLGEAEMRSRAMTWARANPAAAELEPARSIIRREVLTPDWRAMRRLPSRLQGTYRVIVQGDEGMGTWAFRTYDKYSWLEAESARTTADVLGSPYAAGYQLVGFSASTPEALSAVPRRQYGEPDAPVVLLNALDRLTAPGNDQRRTFAGSLEFALNAAPHALWDDIERVSLPPTAMERAVVAAGVAPSVERGRRQPRLPLTIRIGANGTVRADTTLTRDGRRLRVSLERVDTLTLKWP